MEITAVTPAALITEIITDKKQGQLTKVSCPFHFILDFSFLVNE